MFYQILPQSCIHISCVTVQHLPNLEQETPKWKKKMSNFDTEIERKLDINNPLVLKFGDAKNGNHQLSMTPDRDFIKEYSRMINNEAIKDAEELDVDYNNEYLSITLGVPREPDSALHHATVKKMTTNVNGIPIGKANTNLLLDSRM